MSDALSSNNPVKREVEKSYCNAHCRRQFVALEDKYPEEMEWVLETYSAIWKAEAEAKEQEMNASTRLEYHKTHSLPAMEALRKWAQNKVSEEEFEENSALGKAINYLLRHYERLTLFCRKEKVLLDNNRMEEILKIIIRGRKASHFYQTKTGADIANVLTSVIATAYRANINLFDYLVVTQRHKEAVRANAEQWLPWTYEKTLKEIEAPDRILSTA